MFAYSSNFLPEIEYSSQYMIFLILHYSITFAHHIHGNSVVYKVQSLVGPEPTSKIALSSPCKQRHLSKSLPFYVFLLHLSHPPS